LGEWQEITGDLNMSSTGRINNLVNPSSNQDAATKSYVDTSIPIGGIIMWSGAGVTLPSNWKLCDGTTYGTVVTPDLRGRFVLSSGQGSGLTNRTTGQTGGTETVTLTEAQMPQHNHGVGARTGDANGYATDGSHSHSVSETTRGAVSYGAAVDVGGDGGNYQYIQIGGSLKYSSYSTAVDHTHSVSVSSNNRTYNQHPYYDTTGTWHNHAITVTEYNKGSSNAHENMPPFYVLAFIMRVS
jgi:microcystin-dependent protein